ncbi:hypothetical protein F4779DRAFT_613574 [Xylariaceae sp. FL0662B]|nr:hypothetical protein F4779DRAFT_613574 [Xylariaceae sp. FL0662B]
MGMPVVSRNWTRDRRELQRVFRGIADKKWPTWLISFSEATPFNPRSYEVSSIWYKQDDHHSPCICYIAQHLTKAPHVKAVYNFTIAYQHKDKFHEAPITWKTLKLSNFDSVLGYKFHIHTRRFPLEEMPHIDEELA